MIACGVVKAQSADTNTDNRHLSVGLGGSWTVSPYRNYNNKVQPLPLVNYDGDSFYVHGLTAGYRLFKLGDSEFSVVISPLGDEFKPHYANDPKMRRLSERKLSAVAGLAWQYGGSWGTVQASALEEVTGHSRGAVLDAHYNYAFGYNKFRFIPTAGLSYRSRQVNDYYYGVSASEALRSGLPSYRADGGVSPYVGLVAMYKLSDSWLISAGARYTRLPTTVKDSPIVKSGSTENYFVVLNYTF